jgi:hypothetical protein
MRYTVVEIGAECFDCSIQFDEAQIKPRKNTSNRCLGICFFPGNGAA